MKYLLLGSYRAVGDDMGIHHTTIMVWARSDWWSKVRADVEAANATDPVCKDLGRRIQSIVERLVARLEKEEVVGMLGARELGFNIRELTKAQSFLAGDKRDLLDDAAGADPMELNALLKQVIGEYKDSRSFGESGRTLAEEPDLDYMMKMLELEEEENLGAAS